MYTAQGRYCYIEELTTENDKELYELMKENSEEYRYLISDQPIPQTYEEFRETLKIWFTHGRNYQFLVRKKEGDRVVGTFFFYFWDPDNKTTKISVYFIPEVRKTPLIGEALGLALMFAYKIMNVEKVEFSVYKENLEMLKLLEKYKIKKLGETQSEVNPERTLVNFEISEKQLQAIDEKLRKFYERKIR